MFCTEMGVKFLCEGCSVSRFFWSESNKPVGRFCLRWQVPPWPLVSMPRVDEHCTGGSEPGRQGQVDPTEEAGNSATPEL